MFKLNLATILQSKKKGHEQKKTGVGCMNTAARERTHVEQTELSITPAKPEECQ
jgi:hypothetical protein